MNFFDTAWDVTRTPTPQPPVGNAAASSSTSTQQQEPEPTFEQEVNQVIGQLGGFWGAFRAQSQKVMETAGKGFGDVVVQAQKELVKLSAPVEPTDPQAAGASAASPTEGSNGVEQTARSSTDPSGSVSATSSASTSAASVFSRLQSALPPNLVATVQANIPESLKHAPQNVDLAQIRNNLFTEFQRVQGITRVQAEEYARKGEAYLQEVVKEANEVLKDAVKIIPPEEEAAAAGGSGEARGMVWDGTDMWMLPTTESTREVAAEGTSKAGETHTAVASRALALLQRLQSDPSIIKHDPEAEEAGKDQYRKWVEQELEPKGGIEGEEWKKKSDSLLKENTMLYEMYTSLVPAELSKEVFWSRYHFRAHQITSEEERRKALIQATAESDEDFSWEGSDSEEDESPEPKKKEEKESSSEEEEEESEEEESEEEEESSEDEAAPTTASKTPSSTKDLPPPSTQSSTRASSLDGFAVVPPTAGSAEKKAEKKAESESDDSDWE